MEQLWKRGLHFFFFVKGCNSDQVGTLMLHICLYLLPPLPWNLDHKWFFKPNLKVTFPGCSCSLWRGRLVFCNAHPLLLLVFVCLMTFFPSLHQMSIFNLLGTFFVLKPNAPMCFYFIGVFSQQLHKTPHSSSITCGNVHMWMNYIVLFSAASVYGAAWIDAVLLGFR